MASTQPRFQVWHPLTLLNDRYVSDLIFQDGKPAIVVLWDASHTTARIFVELDRRCLHPIKEGGVQYLYDGMMGFTG